MSARFSEDTNKGFWLENLARKSSLTSGAFMPSAMIVTYRLAVSPPTFTTKGTATLFATSRLTIATAEMAVRRTQLNISSSLRYSSFFFSSTVARTKALSVARRAASGMHVKC